MKRTIFSVSFCLLVFAQFLLVGSIYGQQGQKKRQLPIDSTQVIMDMNNKVSEVNSLRNASTEVISGEAISIMSVVIPTTFNYYVATNGSNTNAGTEALPFATIQKAIDVSVTGKAIKVKPGTYYENIDYKGKSIKVVGSPENPQLTIINGGGLTHCVQMIYKENTSTLLSGFTLTNGKAIATTNFHTSKGGGIYLFDNANPTLSQLIITGNTAQVGGGISANHSASPTLENVLIYNNTGTSAGGAAYFYNGVRPVLNNVTIGKNNTNGTTHGAFYLSRGAITTMRNSILWNTESPNEISFNSATTNNSACTITFNYSDKRGGQSGYVNLGTSGYTMTVSWGTGNIDADPAFINYSDVLLYLEGISPCIDAGDPSANFNDINFPPSQGSVRNDIGVYGGPSALTISDLVHIVFNATSTENYLQILSPRMRVNNEEALLNSNEDLIDNNIQYFDGLGRLKQSIDVEVSPEHHDIIQPVEYDISGRQVKDYLAYSATRNGTSSGEYVTSAINDQQNFYNDMFPFEGPFAKSEKKFDNSPMNRVTQQGGPGAIWQPYASSIPNSGHTVKFEYSTNQTTINKFKIDASGNCVSDGTYTANNLFITITKNENWSSGNDNTIWEYKDNQGRTVLIRTFETGAAHDTYYVYDDFGLLACVIPPLANGAVSADLCYFYKYDNRKRLIEKKIPGANIVYMVYDNCDRLVLVQDGVQRLTNNWLFTKYDILNRPAMTGKIQISSRTEAQLRTDFSSYTGVLYESIATTGNIGYTLNNSYPTIIPIIAETNILTINYYDNYDHMSISGFSTFAFSTANDIDTYTDNDGTINGYFDRVLNLNTGSKIKILDGNEHTASAKWVCSVNYFDDRLRAIQTIQNLYDDASGKEIVSNQYDFLNNVLQTRQIQLFNGVTTTLNKYYAYDHTGRLVKIQQEITGDSNGKVTLSEINYNELGQIKAKNLHRTISGFVQQIDYGYTLRGWLKNINNPDNIGNDLFAMKLLYEDASALTNLTKENQFNGNISGMIWKTRENSSSTYLKSAYSFIYDKLNRLYESYYGEGESLSASEKFNEYYYRYDKNGNIQNLKRNNASGVLMDNLVYAYETTSTSNRLKNVTESSSTTEGFKDVVNTADYTYDANGNANKDLNKGFTNITYNYLNLPYTLTKDANNVITYIYDAAGRKLIQVAKIGGNSTSRYYMGNFEYDNLKALSLIQMEEGAVTKASGYSYEYRIRDQLGNTRIVFKPAADGTAILLQKTDYYPFGMIYNNQYTSSTDNQYLYNGKEFQNKLSLDWYDYGARFYDPQIGRWSSTDLYSEILKKWSPYNYSLNNPIFYFDVNGLVPYPFIQLWKNYYLKFGSRVGWREETQSYHHGTDFNYSGGGDTDLNSPTYATHDGYVEVVHQLGGSAGWGLTIKSLNGTVKTKYFHFNSKPDFKVGDPIYEGQFIGRMGGSQDILHRRQSHGHYEVYQKNESTGGYDNINPYIGVNSPYETVNNIQPIDPQLLLQENEVFSGEYRTALYNLNHEIATQPVYQHIMVTPLIINYGNSSHMQYNMPFYNVPGPGQVPCSY